MAWIVAAVLSLASLGVQPAVVGEQQLDALCHVRDKEGRAAVDKKVRDYLGALNAHPELRWRSLERALSRADMPTFVGEVLAKEALRTATCDDAPALVTIAVAVIQSQRDGEKKGTISSGLFWLVRGVQDCVSSPGAWYDCYGHTDASGELLKLLAGTPNILGVAISDQALRALATSKPDVEETFQQRLVWVLQQRGGLWDSCALIAGALKPETLPQLRTIVAKSEKAATYPFAVASTLAELADAETLALLRQRERSWAAPHEGSDPGFTRNAIEIVRTLAWRIEVQSSDTTLLNFIRAAGGSPDGEADEGQRVWAIMRAVNRGIAKETIAQALHDHRNNITQGGAVQTDRSTRGRLQTLKSVAVHIGLMTEADWPDIVGKTREQQR